MPSMHVTDKYYHHKSGTSMIKTITFPLPCVLCPCKHGMKIKTEIEGAMLCCLHKTPQYEKTVTSQCSSTAKKSSQRVSVFGATCIEKAEPYQMRPSSSNPISSAPPGSRHTFSTASAHCCCMLLHSYCMYMTYI